MLAKISDPTLDAAKTTIWINAEYQDFAKASNFIVASIIPMNKGGKGRQTSSIIQDQDKLRGYLGRGHGHGHGSHGSCSGHGGRFGQGGGYPPMAIKATITKLEAFIRVVGFTKVEEEMFLLLLLDVTLMMTNG